MNVVIRSLVGSPPCRTRGIHLLLLLLATACATAPTPEAAPAEPNSVGIGYGDVEGGSVIGSVATANTEDEEVIHSGTLANMLAKIPGVRVVELPGGQMSVQIRGTNSILGGNEPLYVIDGMVIASGAGIFGLSPSTVESITVLKDAGSTAIYGSRGANGVILIKTKKRQS